MHGHVPSKKFFISHSHVQQDQAFQLDKYLREMGHETVVYEFDFLPGQNWVLRMFEASDQSDYTICIMSEDFLKSHPSMSELAAAFAAKKLLMVLFEQVDLPDMLKTINYINLIGLNKGEIYTKLELAITAVVLGTYRFTLQLDANLQMNSDYEEATVIFAQFRQISGASVNPGQSWPYKLRNEMSDLLEESGFKLLEIPRVVTSEAQAKELLENHKAILIVWGTISQDFIEVWYTDITESFIDPFYKRVAQDKKEIGQKKGVVDQKSFNYYVSNIGDTEFVLTSILGLVYYAYARSGQPLMFHKAQELLSRAIHSGPDELSNATVKLRMARSFCSGFFLDFRSAIRDMGWLIEKGFNDAGVYNMRAINYFFQGKVNKAIADHTRSIEMEPDEPAFYINRSRVFLEDGQYYRVIADCTKAFGLNPKDARSYLNRATAYLRQGKYNQALQDYHQVRGMGVEEASLNFWCGFCNMKLERLDLAILYFTQTIEIDQEFGDAYYYRASCHYELHAYQKALEDFTRSIALNPEDSYSFHGRGNTYLALLNFENAIVDLTQALKLGLKETTIYQNRGASYLAVNAFSEAIRDFTQVLKLDSKKPQAFLARAKAHSGIGDYQKSRADLNSALKLNPTDAIALFYRAGVNSLLGSHDEALADFHDGIWYSGQSASLTAREGVFIFTREHANAINMNIQTIVAVEPLIGPILLDLLDKYNRGE